MHACVTEGQLDCASKVLGKEWLFSITLSAYLPTFSYFVLVQQLQCSISFFLELFVYFYVFIFFWPFESRWTDFPTLFSLLPR